MGPEGKAICEGCPIIGFLREVMVRHSQDQRGQGKAR